MSDAWSWAVTRYGDKKLFASRDILGEEDEIQPNGKLFRKLGIILFLLLATSLLCTIKLRLYLLLTRYKLHRMFLEFCVTIKLIFRTGRLQVDVI